MIRKTIKQSIQKRNKQFTFLRITCDRHQFFELIDNQQKPVFGIALNPVLDQRKDGGSGRVRVVRRRCWASRSARCTDEAMPSRAGTVSRSRRTPTAVWPIELSAQQVVQHADW